MAIRLIFILLFSSYSLIGQDICGRIISEQTGEPIENVHVYLKNTSIGTISNSNGMFCLSIKLNIQKHDTLFFSEVGHIAKEITLSELETKSFNVSLSKKVETIDEVTVHSRKLKLKSKLEFTKVTSMELGVFSFGSTMIDNKIYIIGGNASTTNNSSLAAWGNLNRIMGELSIKDIEREFRRTRKKSTNQFSNQIQVYELGNDIWKTYPVDIQNRSCHNVISYKNKLYVLGGKTLSKYKESQFLNNIIEIVDIDEGEVKQDYANPHQAVNFACGLYGDYIMVMGGSIKQNKNKTKVFTSKSHFYDLSTGYWYELDDMTKAKETNGVIIDNRIYLVGGFDGSPLSEIESFDMISGNWKKEGELFQADKNPALAVNGSIIYIFSNSNLLVYNTETNILQTYYLSLPLKESQIHYYANNLYIIGGYEEDRFSKEPSSGIYKIDLSELENTRFRSKNLNQINYSMKSH